MSKEVSLIPSEQEMKAIEVICKYAVDSKYFQSLGGLPGVMCIALYAREIGVPTMTAIMGGFSNVQGKITMSAELMHSLLRGAGVKLKIIRSDSTACEIYGKRSDTGDEYTSTYTIEDAKKANLVKSGGAWEKNPSDMLFARCISRLRRRLAPDIATKAYVEGEVDEEKDNKSVIDVSSTAAIASANEVTVDDDVFFEFTEKFKSIEIAEAKLLDFAAITADKSNKSLTDTLKQAIKNNDRFVKAYNKWAEEKKEVTVEVKALPPPAEDILEGLV